MSGIVSLLFVIVVAIAAIAFDLLVLWLLYRAFVAVFGTRRPAPAAH